MAIRDAQEKHLCTFLLLLYAKNPKLGISLHTSFDDFGEEYKEGKFVAQAHKQSGSPEFILEVDSDFDLPYEEYHKLDLNCTSWRNNGYRGGLPEYMDKQDREAMPDDFDVISISGDPLTKRQISVMPLRFYVVGGCAKRIQHGEGKEHTKQLHN